MIRFPFLEELGINLAAITDLTDGDCSHHGSEVADANRAAICTAACIDTGSLVCGQQSHGIKIATVAQSDAGRGFQPQKKPAFEETDALITNVRGITLAVFVADCAPIYIFDPIHKAIGLIHAGREGSRGRIVQRAIRQMRESFQSQPGDIFALIGPAIGPCCYELSEELAGECQKEGWPVRDRRLDLWAMNGTQLVESGLQEKHIFMSELCTKCSRDFHSYRRDIDRRRNMALLAL